MRIIAIVKTFFRSQHLEVLLCFIFIFFITQDALKLFLCKAQQKNKDLNFERLVSIRKIKKLKYIYFVDENCEMP